MQQLLDGLYNIAVRVPLKVKRLKLAIADLEEVTAAAAQWTAEDRASFEAAVNHHAALLNGMIHDVEDLIAEMRTRTWRTAIAKEKPHYAEMAVTGDEH